MASYVELLAQAKGLMEQAEVLRKTEKSEALSYIRSKMKEFGLKAADLGGERKNKTKLLGGKGELPARFKGPEGQLWSGLGRHPDWLRREMATGKAKDDFKI